MDPIRRWQDAERLASTEGVEKARAGYEALLADRSLAPYAHLRLSVADQQNGDIRGATDHVMRAFGKAHADPELLEMLCKQLLRHGEIRAALACANALAGMNASAGAMAEVGKMLSDRALPEAALPLIQRAMLKGMSSAPMMQYLLGLNLMYVGDLDSARSALESSLAGDPKLAAAHWALAKMGGDGRGIRIDRLRRVLAGPGGDETDSPLLWYSLFQELDHDDQTAEAWNALETAMRLRRAQVRYDEASQDAMYVAATSAIERVKARVISLPEVTGPSPIFIVGMPRTGTTIIEKHLCAQADATSAGELHDLQIQMRWLTQLSNGYHFNAPLLNAAARGDLAELGQRYLQHTQWRARDRPCYTDKWPENVLAIGHILQAIPNARVVCVKRGPADSCFSNLKEWFAASYYYSYDQLEVARQYARFDRYMTAVEELDSSRLTFVEYENFVVDPQGVVSGIVRSLDLPVRFDAPENSSVATASSIQVRGAVSTRNVGSWRRYASQLAPLVGELARLGYA